MTNRTLRLIFSGITLMAFSHLPGPIALGDFRLSAQDASEATARVRDAYTQEAPGQEAPAQEQRDFTQHFRVFTGDGQPATLDDIVEAMAEAEAVLVGEIHTDPVAHWIEAELMKRALETYGPHRAVALSLEMFEWDVQGVVDEYLQGFITETHFKASARSWKHYDADYRTMVEMAKVEGIPVIAANAPRRYVNRVSRLGRESLAELPATAKAFLPPLPYPEPSEAYRSEWEDLLTDMPMQYQCDPPAPAGDEEELHPPHTEGADSVPAHHGATHDTVKAGHGHIPTAGAEADSAGAMAPAHDSAGPRMPTHDPSFVDRGVAAQTLWDASMAHAITRFLNTNPGGLVLHMVGGFHVKNFTGTPEQVEFYRPGTRSLVVSMDLEEDFQTFNAEEYAGSGDFVILTDRSLDLGYERNCLDRESEGSR